MNSLGHKTFLFIALAYSLLITFGSLVNTGDLPKLDYEVSDKKIHFFGYFFFSLFWFLYALFKYLKTSYLKVLLGVCLFSFIYGIVIEVIQGVFIDTRQADIYDAIANGLGVLTALMLLLFLRNKIIKLKSNI